LGKALILTRGCVPGVVVLAALWCFATPSAFAADPWTLPSGPMPYSLGGQTTVVWQYHPRFHSPYEAANSLRHEHENAVSHSYDLYVGVRPLPWLDVYVNPEMIRGGGISDGIGLAGYTNGEVIRQPASGHGSVSRSRLRACDAAARRRP